jgi:hypothetical protein
MNVRTKYFVLLAGYGITRKCEANWRKRDKQLGMKMSSIEVTSLKTKI